MNRKRTIGLLAVFALTFTVVSLLPAGQAGAHGATTDPGSRTYLCYLDGQSAGGDLQPNNPACAAAVAIGGKQPLWDWFGVLRSDGQGRTVGFIPNGQLCSGGNPTFDAYNLARNDWPATRLTSGANYTVHYSAWAAHPGTFYLYATNSSYNPTTPLAWSHLDSQPFSTWTETQPNGQGEYYWSAQLPARSGRQIIYSVWARSDSQETFYGCADVVFDGGNGQRIGVGPGSGGTTTTTRATTTTTRAATTTTTRAATTTTTRAGTTTTTRAATTTTTRAATTTTTRAATTTTTRAATTTTTRSGSGISCSVRIDQWGSGYVTYVTVRNNGSAVSNWSVPLTFNQSTTITNSWSVSLSGSGSSRTASNVSYNGNLGSGASTEFGFQGTTNGAFSATCG